MGGLYTKHIHRKEIKLFCGKTGRIFREDIKVCKLYIRKAFGPEPEKIV